MHAFNVSDAKKYSIEKAITAVYICEFMVTIKIKQTVIDAKDALLMWILSKLC